MKRENMAKNLKQLRLKKSAQDGHFISQEEVAKAIGVSASSYSKWEAGQGTLKFETAWALADYFDVPIGELGGRTKYELNVI